MFYLAFSKKIQADEVEKIINEHLLIKDIKDFPAYSYFKKYENSNIKINGWSLYKEQDEFERMGITNENVIDIL